MSPSRLFIQRPVATLLLMIALLLSGLLAYRLLPQSALPQVDYPTIQVVTMYPGAGPEVMATSVTAPLERQLGSMTGLNQMFSSSSDGISIITLQFALHVPLDEAEQYVQAAINAAANYLPNDLPNPPIYNKVNPADAAVITLAVSADSLTLPQLRDLVETRLLQKISQVSGVGLVSLGGGNRPAVRVRVHTQALASLGIGFDAIRNAIGAANSNQAKGNIDGTQLSIAIDANSQIRTAKEYGQQIIAVKNGSTIRLSDVAEVTDDVENTYQGAWLDGKPVILLSVQRQPGANVIRVVDRIRQILPELQHTLPAEIQLEVVSDRTIGIRSAIHDVKTELFTAIVLVILVIFLFLRSLSGTLIPSLAVPLSLVGTLTIMYWAGFSINNLTLMALTIATGFVVDDAIVMIENISRYIEDGLAPMQAALVGAQQIGFTIISLTFSLIAVLIPLLFMEDVVGRLFREFASTLAIAILISALVSLTLTPMLSARLLKPAKPNTEHGWQSKISKRFDQLAHDYANSLKWVLAHQSLILRLTVLTVGLTLVLIWQIPKGFFPEQDNGLIQAVAEAPQSISYVNLVKEQQEIVDRVLSDDAVEHVTSSVGVDRTNPMPNAFRLFITLKPHSKRKDSASAVVRRLEQLLSEHDSLTIRFQPVQDLTVDTRNGPTSYQLSIASLDSDALQTTLNSFLTRMKTLPQLTDVSSSVRDQALKAYVEVDRDAAARLGVTMAGIDDALYSAFGQRFISTIFTQNNQYRVVIESDLSESSTPDTISQLYVTSSSGLQIPLSSLVRISTAPASLLVTRQDQFPAVLAYFNVAEGYSLGDAVEAIENVKQQLNFNDSIDVSFQGAAKSFQNALDNELILIVAAIITMYIVLGVLYESYIHPLTILSTLPSAAVGALLALQLTGNDLSIIAIIGIILLIGIVQKNAIMMIDFALQAERQQGQSPQDAIYQASILRFRPILMTTLAAIFSALPLVFGNGSGAELRQPLGVVMVGGLIFSQILTLYTTPVIYLAFDRFSRKIHSKGWFGSVKQGAQN